MGPFHTAPDPMETTVRTAAHPDVFADRHLGPTEAERAAMLETLGFDSLDALADAAVPADIRFDRALDLPDARSERELLDELAGRR